MKTVIPFPNVLRKHIKITVACMCIASFLQWVTFQMLIHMKLGLPAECFALAQTFVVLLVSPYLAALSANAENRSAYSGRLLSLTPAPIGRSLFLQLAISQGPLLCWLFLSTGFALFATSISIKNVLKMLVVLGVYSFSAGAIGMLFSSVLKDVIFGTACTHFLWFILIGSAFLLMPIERYVDNLQPIYQPVLYLNPLIAVCYIFEMDIFRNPLFYELTPITSYDYSYPSWYVIGLWQFVIGGCCFLWTWHKCRSSKFATIC